MWMGQSRKLQGKFNTGVVGVGVGGWQQLCEWQHDMGCKCVVCNSKDHMGVYTCIVVEALSNT